MRIALDSFSRSLMVDDTICFLARKTQEPHPITYFLWLLAISDEKLPLEDILTHSKSSGILTRCDSLSLLSKLYQTANRSGELCCLSVSQLRQVVIKARLTPHQ